MVSLSLAGADAKGDERVAQIAPSVEGSAADKARNTDQQPAPPLPDRVVEGEEEASARASRERRADEHDAKDLDAQVRTAQAAEKQLGLAYVQLGLSIAGAIGLFWSVWLGRQANKAAVDALRVSQQLEAGKLLLSSIEWEFGEKISAYRPDIIAQDLKTLPVTVALTNYGRSPAFVDQSGAWFVIGGLPGDPDYAGAAAHTRVIKPDEATSIPVGARVTDDDVKGLFDGSLSWWLYGVVKYRDFLDEPHEARFLRKVEIYHIPRLPKINAFAPDPPPYVRFVAVQHGDYTASF